MHVHNTDADLRHRSYSSRAPRRDFVSCSPRHFALLLLFVSGSTPALNMYFPRVSSMHSTQAVAAVCLVKSRCLHAFSLLIYSSLFFSHTRTWPSRSILVGRGGLVTILCIWWGEMTNPLQNSWYIACALAEEGVKWAKRVQDPLTYATALVHVVVRGLYVPWVSRLTCIHMRSAHKHWLPKAAHTH
jgi:hypothetical protein